MYVGNSVTGFMIEVPIDLRSNNTKESSAAHARMVAAVIGSDFVITVTEGWCLPENQHPNRDEIIKRYGSIKAYPHRVEIAFFLLETHHNFHFAMVPILSSRLSGKRRQLGEVTWTCLPTVEGRFTAILPALTPR